MGTGSYNAQDEIDGAKTGREQMANRARALGETVMVIRKYWKFQNAPSSATGRLLRLWRSWC